MVVGQRSHGYLFKGAITFHWFLLATVVVSYFMTTCNCLPTLKEKKPTHPNQSLLSGAVSEIEDALSRLRQYAKSLNSEVEPSSRDDEDPLAESVERESRDEDYRQEPELVPGLDRFEKTVDESRHKPGPKSGGDSDDVSDISLQELANFLRENAKDGKTEGERRFGAKSTAKTITSSTKDISLKDLLEFLKERQNQKNEENQGVSVRPPSEYGPEKTKPVAKDDARDVSLNDALEYLASLKKKLGDQKNNQVSH